MSVTAELLATGVTESLKGAKVYLLKITLSSSSAGNQILEGAVFPGCEVIKKKEKKIICVLFQLH